MKNISKSTISLLVLVVMAYPSVAIIKSVFSKTQGPAEVTSASESGTEFQWSVLPYTLRVGEKLFANYCSVCHGESGDGLGFNAYTLEVKPRNFSDAEYMNELSDARIFETIGEGGRGVNKSVLMPVWGTTLSELEISFLVDYIRSFAVIDTVASTPVSPR